jgi:hypothetical protein
MEKPIKSTALVTRMREDVLGAHHSSKCAGVAHGGSQLVETRKDVVGGKVGCHSVVLEGAYVMGSGAWRAGMWEKTR